VIAAVAAAIGPHSLAGCPGERFERVRCDRRSGPFDRILGALRVKAGLVARRGGACHKCAKKLAAGNAEDGRTFALRACTGCHVVAPDQPFKPIYTGPPRPPDFKEIAKRPNLAAASLLHHVETLPAVPKTCAWRTRCCRARSYGTSSHSSSLYATYQQRSHDKFWLAHIKQVWHENETAISHVYLPDRRRSSCTVNHTTATVRGPTKYTIR
jgi:hypothetical protein